MTRERINVGKAELPILRYVADNQPVSVGEVAAYFLAQDGLARTTVLTMMGRLRKKGFLVRKKVKGVFLYSPRQAKQELMRSLVRDFVDKTLGGIVSPFVAFLADEATVSAEELEELKRIVSKIETRKEQADHESND